MMSNETQHDATSLTPQQDKAAEMLAAGQRVCEVAQAVGVDRATLWRWKQLPEFQEHENELRRLAWRAAADRMRTNAVAAADVLGTVLADPTAPARDRIAAARVVLGAAGPLFNIAPKAKPQPVELRGVPPVEGGDWRSVLLNTAKRAAAMDGRLYVEDGTPGKAWADSGLEGAFPGSFARLRALADRPEELQAECDRILVDWQDVLDRVAIDEATEDANEG